MDQRTKRSWTSDRLSARCLTIGLSGFLALAASPNAIAAAIVSPSAQTSVEGNDNNGFPFNIALFNLSSQRYEQVYSATEFGSGPLLITGLAFRPDDNGRCRVLYYIEQRQHFLVDDDQRAGRAQLHLRKQ